MRRRARAVRLELTPLMDVMFLVLVFFVYAVFDRTVHHGVKVELPTAGGEKETFDQIVVTIRSDDTLQLNGIDLGREELLARMRKLVASGVKLPVLIAGDRAASLGQGIGLLEELRRAGVERATFQVSGGNR